jgi:hypothetical protein
MVERSEHFKERYDERVCSKTKRAQLFSDRAFYLGREAERVQDARLRNYLLNCEDSYSETGRIAKAYKGQVYIFDKKIAVTVFPLPNKLRALA